jgi:hypothetical protein
MENYKIEKLIKTDIKESFKISLKEDTLSKPYCKDKKICCEFMEHHKQEKFILGGYNIEDYDGTDKGMLDPLDNYLQQNFENLEMSVLSLELCTILEKNTKESKKFKNIIKNENFIIGEISEKKIIFCYKEIIDKNILTSDYSSIHDGMVNGVILNIANSFPYESNNFIDF